MNKAARLNAEQREDLVAYLDGELPEVETQAIDQMLARSEVARHEVEALARTWELLDLLAQPNSSPDFTERTLTTLKVSEQSVSITDQPWFGVVRKGALAVVWGIVLTSCALAGYFVTSRAIPNPEAEMLAKLPLLKNLDLYLQIDDLEFVNALRRQTDFTPTATAGAPAPPVATRRLSTSEIDQVAHQVLTTREVEAAQLPQTERDRILKNWELFQQLPAARQAELMEFHRRVSAEPEAVHALLEAYALWLQTLSPGQRDDLRKATDAGGRLELVRRFKSEQEASRETQMFDLNLDVRRGLSFWWRHPYLKREELATVMASARQQLEVYDQKRVDDLPTDLEKYILTLQLLMDPRSNRRISDEALERVIAAIPNEQVSRYIQRNERSEDRRRELFRQIGVGMLAFVFEEMQTLLPTEKELEQFFVSDQIDGETRYELMQLPPHMLTPDLVKRYFEGNEDPRVKQLEGIRRRLQETLLSLFGPRPPGFPSRGDRSSPRGEGGNGGPRDFDGRPNFGPGRFGPPPPNDGRKPPPPGEERPAPGPE